jgi:hypothetical protein
MGARDARRRAMQQLLAEIRQQISDLPSYGYRRACALVNRQRSALGGNGSIPSAPTA